MDYFIDKTVCNDIKVKFSGWKILFPLILFFYTLNSESSSLQLRGVKLQECRQEYCVSLISDKVSQSTFSRIFAFDLANIQVKIEGQNNPRVFLGYSGSYDIKKGLYFLTKGDKEVLIDSVNKNIIEF